MLDTTRREFIGLIGGGCLLLAVKVKRAWGQQPAMPVVGFLSGRSPSESDRRRRVGHGRLELAARRLRRLQQ